MQLDILINYATRGSSSEADHRKWAEDFARFLKAMLIQIVGDEPNLLLLSDVEAPSKTELKKADFMICLMSREFVDNDQCINTVEEFAKLTANDENDMPRIFSVIKSYVPALDQPAILRRLIPYSINPTATTEEIEDLFVPTAGNGYWMKIVDLAYDIINSFEQLENSKKETKSIYQPETIYLAETNDDVSVQRNIIKRELLRQGYKVVPRQALPTEPEDLKNTIREALKKSIMAVHLIGHNYGEIINGLDRSLVDIQNKIATEMAASPAIDDQLQRLIWINPDQAQADGEQKTFIENIQRDTTTLDGAEILQIPLEEFKDELNDELNKGKDLKNGVMSALTTSRKKQNVYFIYDKVDETEVIPIKKGLIKAGFNLTEPDFSDGAFAMRNSHLEHLKQFDIGIIYQGKVNPNWTKIKLLDLLKAPGLGREKPILGRAIISGAGIEINEKFFQEFDVELLSMDNDTSITEQLDEFIKTLTVAI